MAKAVEKMTKDELMDEFRSTTTAGRNGQKYDRFRLRKVSDEINRRLFNQIKQEETP